MRSGRSANARSRRPHATPLLRRQVKRWQFNPAYLEEHPDAAAIEWDEWHGSGSLRRTELGIKHVEL